MKIQPGTRIKSYEILELIGRGGMADVYKARHVSLEVDVAIKFIRKERFPQEILPSVIKRFHSEARRMAKLSHPNIVRVSDDGVYRSVPYFVMDYLPGGTLKRRMGVPVPWQDAAKLLTPIAEALAYAHSEGVIHRDVKPANILLAKSGQPMLSDFGVAKIMDSEHTQGLTATGASIGTPEYMAPEQAAGDKIDHRVDIYSLGVIFYELVTGRRPFTADTPMNVIIKQATEPLPSPSRFVKGLPKSVEQMLFTALAKQPSERFADMGAMATALRGLASGVPLKIKASAPARKKSAAAKKKVVKKAKTLRAENKSGKGWLIGAAGIAMVGLVIFAGVKLFGSAGETTGIEQTEEMAVVVQETPAPEVTNTPSFTATPTVDPYIISKENINKIDLMYTIPLQNIFKASRDFSLILGVDDYYWSSYGDFALWDTFSNKLVENKPLSMDGHWVGRERVFPITFSEDNQLIFIGTNNEGVIILDSKTFQEVNKIETDNQLAVSSLASSPSYKYLAVGLEDGSFSILDTNTWEVIFTHSEIERDCFYLGQNSINQMGFSKDDGFFYAYNRCSLKVWKTKSWEEKFEYGIEDFRAWSSIVYADFFGESFFIYPDESFIHVINLSSDKDVCTYQYTDKITGGKKLESLIALRIGDAEKTYEESGLLTNSVTNYHWDFFDVNSCKNLLTVSHDYAYKQQLCSVVLSNDEKLIITSPCSFSHLRVFDFKTQELLKELKVENAYANGALAISEDGRYLIASYSDLKHRIWGIPQP
jgi:serine/threonine protein kinase